LKQQAEQRERGEEIDRQRGLEEKKEKKEAAIAAGPTRKSSRSATAQKAQQPDELKSVTKSRSSAGTKATKKKGEKMDIANYFKGGELDTNMSTAEALKQAQEADEAGETEAGVTSITKPSASARQPELVTGCILRDYQVHVLQVSILIKARWVRVADKFVRKWIKWDFGR
jgi:hypothetical protein